MTYKSHSIQLTDGQKQSLAKAYNQKSPITLRLKHGQLSGTNGIPLMLTDTQINNINKSKRNSTGLDLRLSKTQITAQSKSGGFLGALAGLLLKLAPKVLAPLATGALSGLASTGIGKLFGNGMVTIDRNKKNELLRSPYLTKQQINKLNKAKGDVSIQLTKAQQQNGGFLPLLIGALAAPLLASIFGKGLQVDRGTGLQVDSQIRPYRRIPKKIKKFF